MAEERERESSWEEFWELQGKLARRDVNGDDPVTNNYSLREFVSYSAGTGKRRRRARDVALVVDLNTGKAKTLKDTPGNGLDTIAQSLLGHLLEIDDPFAEFVRRLRRAQKHRF